MEFFRPEGGGGAIAGFWPEGGVGGICCRISGGRPTSVYLAPGGPNYKKLEFLRLKTSNFRLRRRRIFLNKENS